ncbi:MAG: hypothetical protein EA398_08875 [Deltaproteobacteria bacterium]|nr:MAG: hypothetical protein EA398_08875 [Deltaproteobacteria bacterium]
MIRHKRTHRTFVWLGTLLLVLGAGPLGCGDDESGEPGPSASSVTSTEGHSSLLAPSEAPADTRPPQNSASVTATGPGASDAPSTSVGTNPTESRPSVETAPSVSSSREEVAVTSSEPASSSGLTEVGPAEPCDGSTLCPEGYRCVHLDPGHALGVCSPECDTIGSLCGYYGPGTWAKCLLTLEDDTHACGFLCVRDHGDHAHTHDCPSGDWGRLRCERQPRTDGHRFCAPRQP